MELAKLFAAKTIGDSVRETVENSMQPPPLRRHRSRPIVPASTSGAT
jgi:hypothetical protein